MPKLMKSRQSCSVVSDSNPEPRSTNHGTCWVEPGQGSTWRELVNAFHPLGLIPYHKEKAQMPKLTKTQKPLETVLENALFFVSNFGQQRHFWGAEADDCAHCILIHDLEDAIRNLKGGKDDSVA